MVTEISQYSARLCFPGGWPFWAIRFISNRLPLNYPNLFSLAFPKIIHVARHTFATTVALANGVSIESLSKMLGHTKITTTQIYAKMLNSKVGADMDALAQRINYALPS